MVLPDTLRFLYDSCACLMPFTQTRLRLKQCVRWHQLAQIIWRNLRLPSGSTILLSPDCSIWIHSNGWAVDDSSWSQTAFGFVNISYVRAKTVCMNCRFKPILRKRRISSESKIICKADLRKMQDHQKKRIYQSNLWKSKTQTASGLIDKFVKRAAAVWYTRKGCSNCFNILLKKHVLPNTERQQRPWGHNFGKVALRQKRLGVLPRHPN